ncbi:proton myo-inositol cotransporter isoform X1 [Lethenteron reissneri]|uniref:proton myo-inositol cotransporter isoform X1 n=1 Tax=Lethenteron reissneri TaxID=7753 RepID=UPI002AB7DC79|nr:proton myo-inositol cotransporter isoform X1 [Lethenteron reissneri]XP_061430070.1 proton myo-inositol cotransporter isoform X1 [Lethenteron reissneri]
MGGRRGSDTERRRIVGPGSSESNLGGDGAEPAGTGPPTPTFIFVLCAFSAIGGFLFGYDTGVVSGAMLLLKRRYALNAAWQAALVSAAVGAAALLALLGGWAADCAGRRPVVLAASTLFAVGSLALGLAQGPVVLLVGRVIVGCGIGLASMAVPMYIAEASPPHLRGRLVTINALFITGGQFCASVIDGAFSYLPRDGWRYMLGLAGVPAVVQFVGFLFLPESPRWLARSGHTQHARRVLCRMRGTQNIDEEFDRIQASITAEEEDDGSREGDATSHQPHSRKGWVLWKMIKHPPTRRALVVGCGLQMFQQLAGINTVMYYSATILQMAGVADDSTAIWLASATAFTNFVFSGLGVWLVERVGRRQLSLISMAGTTLSLALLGCAFLLASQTSPPVILHPHDPAVTNSSCMAYSVCETCMLDPRCGFCFGMNGSHVDNSSCLPADPDNTDQATWGRCSSTNATQRAGLSWAYNYCPTPYSWLALLGLILYLMCFAPGMGSTPWTVNSEIYPLWARSTGNSMSATVNWVCNLAVSLTFLQLAQSLTYYGVFFMYTGLGLLGVLFIATCVPETRGRTLEEMEALFAGAGSCVWWPGRSGAGSAPQQVEYIRVTGANGQLSDTSDAE